MDADGLAPRQDAGELIRIHRTERGGRDRLYAIGPHLDTAMGETVLVGADRPDEDGSCALARRDAGALAVG